MNARTIAGSLGRLFTSNVLDWDHRRAYHLDAQNRPARIHTCSRLSLRVRFRAATEAQAQSNHKLERIDTMKRLLPLVVITLLAATTLCIAQTGAPSKPESKPTAGNSLDQMIIDRSKQVWEAYKSRNIAAI